MSNAILAQLSQRYNLIDRLVADRTALLNLKRGERANANLFEAYIAGLYLSYIDDSKGDIEATGRAFTKISEYLYPLFRPIAEWALGELKAESKRIEASQTADDEADHIDRLAQGSTALLNEHFTKYHKALPTYDAQRLGEQTWTIVCTVKDRNDKT